MDWYVKSSLNKIASKEIYYHGTSFDRLQSILSKGLIPNHKDRVWAEDPAARSTLLSRKSFEGIYLTNNFMTAKISAGTAGKDSRQGLLIVVQVETKTLVADEDNLTYLLQDALSSINEGLIMNEWLTLGTYIAWKKNEFEENFIGTANKFLDMIFKFRIDETVPEITRQKTRENSVGLIVELLKSLLERNTAYIIKESSSYENNRHKYEFENSGLDISMVPSAEVAEENFRKYLDLATRKLSLISRKREGSNTARSIEPISFSGANRILCIMSYHYPNERDEKTKLKFHYCSSDEAKSKLVSEWQTNIGGNFVIV